MLLLTSKPPERGAETGKFVCYVCVGGGVVVVVVIVPCVFQQYCRGLKFLCRFRNDDVGERFSQQSRLIR